MHVLTISTDKKILDTNSAVAARMVAQANVPAAAWDSSVLIVCTTGTHAPVQLAHNVMAYPTNSASKLAYGLDVLRLGMQHGRAADVISAQDPFEVGLVGTLLGWSLRRPVQLQVHTDFLSPTFVGHSTLNRVRVWIAGAILPKAKRVRVVSQRIQQSLNRVYKHLPPIDVLPVFVDIEHITATQLSDALRERFGRFVTKVLVVARFESEKNVGLAIDAFSQSAKPDACLILVGEGSQEAMLREKVLQLGLAERVFFEGWQDPAAYYQLASLVLVPSVYEGYGMVVAEAHAADVPVLATDVGIARESGAMISSPEKFAEALAQWFAGTLQEGEVVQYPYTTKAEYMAAYNKCLTACLDKSQ